MEKDGKNFFNAKKLFWPANGLLSTHSQVEMHNSLECCGSQFGTQATPKHNDSFEEVIND